MWKSYRLSTWNDSPWKRDITKCIHPMESIITRWRGWLPQVHPTEGLKFPAKKITSARVSTFVRPVTDRSTKAQKRLLSSVAVTLQWRRDYTSPALQIKSH